jgi:hypothetical protein
MMASSKAIPIADEHDLPLRPGHSGVEQRAVQGTAPDHRDDDTPKFGTLRLPGRGPVGKGHILKTALRDELHVPVESDEPSLVAFAHDAERSVQKAGLPVVYEPNDGLAGAEPDVARAPWSLIDRVDTRWPALRRTDDLSLTDAAQLAMFARRCLPRNV